MCVPHITSIDSTRWIIVIFVCYCLYYLVKIKEKNSNLQKKKTSELIVKMLNLILLLFKTYLFKSDFYFIRKRLYLHLNVSMKVLMFIQYVCVAE